MWLWKVNFHYFHSLAGTGPKTLLVSVVVQTFLFRGRLGWGLESKSLQVLAGKPAGM